ncbi:hypothetical protein CERSUDRAFT_109846 [Gelatoporia subvermispora B]|uniref:Uncharacterized protein n=1 Tax=Ceriporiopsis subvermispora (strain B) TaxID=914234 RepID=M2R9X7_CERS8|nr:hypothetical protein CERSUDRAFT_109846 [Gelatoporia subvermispora B]
MLSIADDTVAVTDFSSLRTITVSLEKNHPFDLQSARAAVDSHLYLRWTEMFLMSSMSITIYGKQVLEKREGTTEPSTEGIILSISMGPGHEPENRIAVTYTRRGCA